MSALQLMMARARINHARATSSLSALLHFDGANGSTTFTDQVSSNIWTPTGAVISTAQSKFGGSSAYFNGSSHLTGPASPLFGFGAGDYTFECWLYSTGGGSDQCLFDTRSASNQGIGIYVVLSSYSGSPGVANNNAVIAGGGSRVPLNTWTHYAVCRQAGKVYGFVGGVLRFTVTDARTYASVATPIIGFNNYTGTQGYTGYLDELRVLKGVALYTTDFTPPSAPFPNS